MKIADGAIKEALLKGKYLGLEDLKKAEKNASLRRESLADYLLINNLITNDLLGQAIAEFFGFKYADLNTYIPDPEQIKKIPEALAKKYRLVLFSINKTSIVIATDNPEIDKKAVTAELAKIFEVKKIVFAYSLTADIEASLAGYRKKLETRFAEIIKQQKRVAPEIIEEIFKDALTFRASDIHFEPQDQEIIVRFRVDGVMQEAGRMPKVYYENILNRIKVKSQLRTDEHLAAQDGSLVFSSPENTVDMRVSIVPTVLGEKIVIRVLSHYVQGLGLMELGLSERHQAMIEKSANKPFGMILVTGPTGSGKTTTLYAVLAKINSTEINITTIEDPVEYRLPGVNQIQVNNQTNLSFAKGLRSIVRQDPDVILVGEIRDEETVEIAINAALTGHLLLSTFHANDAASSIPRLLDMEAEPFLLSSTLDLIIAQRLARKICDNCRVSESFKLSDIVKVLPSASKYFKGSGSINLYKGKGCPMCGGTGYLGRVAIFELIEITPAMQDLIMTNPAVSQITDLARRQGTTSLFEDGIEKVKSGLTTLSELMRVAEPPK